MEFVAGDTGTIECDDEEEEEEAEEDAVSGIGRWQSVRNNSRFSASSIAAWWFVPRMRRC